MGKKKLLINHAARFLCAALLSLIDDTKVRYSKLSVKNTKRRLLNGFVSV